MDNEVTKVDVSTVLKGSTYKKDTGNRLQNLPNYQVLGNTLEAYLELDGAKIQEQLIKEFEGVTMSFAGLRFFNSFIKQQANLFSNPFDRSIEGVEQEVLDELTEEEQDVERYYHVFKKAALLVNFTNGFRALAPTEYFFDVPTGNYYVGDGERTLFFYKASEERVLVYVQDKSFQECVESEDTSISIEDNGWLDTGEVLPIMPIVEWSFKKIAIAQSNELIPLERNFIIAISWGLWNANPKLVQHVMATTNLGITKIQEEMLPNFGKSNRVSVIPIGSELKVFDTGDITVLKDLLGVYAELISQRALLLGVDKNAVVPTSVIESGEAKKVVLQYINSTRNTFIYGAKNFEKKVIAIMEKLGYTIKYSGIQFRPLEMVADVNASLTYAKAMLIAGFWSFPEALSYVLDISLKDAETKIEELGLKPEAIYFGDEE